MICTFQSYRIHSTFRFALCIAVLWTFKFALSFKYFAPLYGSWNHHRLQADLRCDGQLVFGHQVSVADSCMSTRKQRWLELLLIEKCRISNNSSGLRKWHYDDAHINRKRHEKGKKQTNRWYHHHYSPFTRWEYTESCSTAHHHHHIVRKNPTARSWKQQHHGDDLNWKNTSLIPIEFWNAGPVMLNRLSDSGCFSAVNSQLLPFSDDDNADLGCSSIFHLSNNGENPGGNNFTLNVGKLLDSLPDDTRLIFRHEPDLSLFSDNVVLMGYNGRTLLSGLRLYKIFCCFLRLVGQIPGVDPLVIIEKVSIAAHSSPFTYT